MRPKLGLLRTKLLLWLIVPLALLLAADTFVSYWAAHKFSSEAHDRALLDIAREVSLHVRVRANKPAFELPDAARDILLNDPEDTLFYEVATSAGNHLAGALIPRVPIGADRSPLPHFFYDATVDGKSVRVVEYRSLANSGAGVAGSVVRVAETRVKRAVLERDILTSVIVPQVLLILLAVTMVWAAVNQGMAPLETLRRAVEARDERDRSPLAVNGMPGEVRPLLRSINRLLTQLDAALVLQRRFVADAAHQLKAPISALQAQLEMAQREGRGGQGMEDILSAVDRLNRLVTQLLALARNAPEATAVTSFRPVDLGTIAFEAASKWVPDALRKRIDLGFEGESSGITIHGEASRLRDLLDNLIDNAIRYSREGGRVTVRTRPGPVPSVSVSDDGPGIPESEAGRIFERFYRTLGNASEGSGLGLAIAREIADLHGATITLRDDGDGVGTLFEVVFAGSSSKIPST